jgi:phosphoglycolate phosphatase-like HAD superfamily hydrolase
VSESYPALIRQLAELTARVDAQRAEAHAWYDSQCAAAERAVQAAGHAVRRADAAVAAAQEELESTESEAAHLWQALRTRIGLPGRRIGPPPAPAPGAAADPAALVDGVRELLDRAKRPGDLPSSANPLLVVFGVLGAAAASALGFAARLTGHRYGGDLAVGMPVLGLVVTLLGPVVGVAPAKLLADRRHATLGPRPVTVVVLAGLLTTAALFALLR